MAPPLTAQQIEELQRKADARDAQLAAEKERKDKEAEREQRGMFMSMLGGIWDNIGTIFIIAFVGFMAWSHFGGEKIKDFFSGIADTVIGWLPADWQEGAKKFVAGIKGMFGGDVSEHLLTETPESVIADLEKATGVDKAILKTHIGEKASKDALVNLLKKANGDKLSKDDLTNDKSIYALMTSPTFAPLLQEIAKASLAKGTDGKLSDKAKPILDSLKLIVADERLDTLFNAQNRARTVELLKTIKQGDAAQIDQLLATGVKDGKATTAFRGFLTTMLTTDANGQLPGKEATEKAVKTYLGADPQAAVMAVNTYLTTTEAGKAFQANNGGKSYAAMSAALGGEDNVKKLLFDFAGKKEQSLEQMKFALENRKGFDAYIAAAGDTLKTLPAALAAPLGILKSIPVAATPAIIRIIDKGVNPLPLRALVVPPNVPFTEHLTDVLLLDKNLRATMLAADPKDVLEVAKVFAKEQKINLPAAATPENITAIVKAAEAMSASLNEPVSAEAMKKMTIAQKLEAQTNNAANAQTLNAVHAFTTALMTEDMSKVTRADVAAMLGNPTNNQALYALLGSLAGDSVDANKAAVIGALIKPNNWKVLTALAADKDKGLALVHEKLQGMFNKSTAASCKAPETELKWWQEIALKSELTSSKVMVENAEGIKALKHDLAVAACTGMPVPPTPPATQPHGFGQSLFGWR